MSILSNNDEIEDIKCWVDNNSSDIEYVYTQNGELVFSKYNEIEDSPPLLYNSKKNNLALKNYRIYGNTVSGESVGDLVESGEHSGEYVVPVKIEGKNLLQNTATSRTINEVTFTVNDDGGVTCNGTATSNTFFKIGNILTTDQYFILTGCPTNGGHNSYLLRYLRNNVVIAADYGSGTSINQIIDGFIEIRIASGYNCDNLTFYPMIRKADVEDNTYEPYQPPITTNLYLPEPLKIVGDEAEYIDYKEQKQHFADGTSTDITLPALPILSGINILSVNTNIQPSSVYLKGKITVPPTAKIYYYSQDGLTLLYTEFVTQGEDGAYSVAPIKASTAQYNYTFVGWNTSPNQTTATSGCTENITFNTNVYAAFSESVRTYTVYFYNDETLLQTVQNVPYGGSATYTEATPAKSGYNFTGWSPAPTNISGDTSCYAQFE